MEDLLFIKQEKEGLLNSVISEMEAREKALIRIQKEKQALETQAFIIQGALAMLDELIARDQTNNQTEAKE